MGIGTTGGLPTPITACINVITRGGSSISYAQVVANYLHASGYRRYYHSESMVPWLFNGSTFISYEDEQSMRLKAKYVKDNGLAGGDDMGIEP